MTSKIEVPRELLDRAILAIEHGTLLMSEAVDLADELRGLISAPEAPRQEPVSKELSDELAELFTVGFLDDSMVSAIVQVVRKHSAPLSPDHSGGGAGMVLPERAEKDGGFFSTQLKVNGWNACLDKVKELNQ